MQNTNTAQERFPMLNLIFYANTKNISLLKDMLGFVGKEYNDIVSSEGRESKRAMDVFDIYLAIEKNLYDSLSGI